MVGRGVMEVNGHGDCDVWYAGYMWYSDSGDV